MAGITKKELSARRQRLRDELPNHGWDYVEAGIAAGYSKSYAKSRLKKYATKDINFCQQATAKRAEIEAATQDQREKCLKVLDSIIEDEKAAARDRIRATEVRGRMCGWMSETRVLETGSRQRELTQAEREEAQRLAVLRFSPHYAQEALTPPASPAEAFPSVPQKFSGAGDNLDETYPEAVRQSHERAQLAGGPGQ